MQSPPIAAGPYLIDPDWMTRALRASGDLPHGQVTDVHSRPVGNGLVGDSFRFELRYDGAPEGAPSSVVGKFPAEDAASRASGAGLRLYLREVSFYRDVARTVDISTPRPIYADIDPQTHDFTLILEDLGPARAGDQLEGCSVEDAATALKEAAALHAPRWGDPGLARIDWLNPENSEMTGQIAAALPMVVAAFKDRYQGQLEPECLALVDRLPAAVVAMQGVTDFPVTLQHADFRLDNILFDVKDGARRMGTLDWQTITLGPALTDVSYFLSAGLSPETRREHERDLVSMYHAELMQRGVRDYPLDAAWRDYQRFAVHGVLMGVFSAMAVERTDRGDALFLKMTRGGCLQALDHGTFGMWG
ncbi:MAG: hypothetical protein CFE28_07475 [Alphaproteobacteria bacterium PA2]|nr:MAG: hypothetical protein CFE28_07475 [Alphaproteobacteria bacterium PA2]